MPKKKQQDIKTNDFPQELKKYRTSDGMEFETLQARMIEHSYPVSITNFQMINIDYSSQFEQAIENKVIAEQKALEEANVTKQVEQQAKQQVVQSEAEAKAIRIKAQALQQNAQLIELEAVKKWDGKLPQIMTGNSTPILDIRSLNAN